MEAVITLDSRDKYEKILIDSIRKSPGGELPSIFAGIAFHGRAFESEQSLHRNGEETYEIITFKLRT